jgi:hypothetical protein
MAEVTGGNAAADSPERQPASTSTSTSWKSRVGNVHSPPTTAGGVLLAGASCWPRAALSATVAEGHLMQLGSPSYLLLLAAVEVLAIDFVSWASGAGGRASASAARASSSGSAGYWVRAARRARRDPGRHRHGPAHQARSSAAEQEHDAVVILESRRA